MSRLLKGRGDPGTCSRGVRALPGAGAASVLIATDGL